MNRGWFLFWLLSLNQNEILMILSTTCALAWSLLLSDGMIIGSFPLPKWNLFAYKCSLWSAFWMLQESDALTLNLKTVLFDTTWAFGPVETRWTGIAHGPSAGPRLAKAREARTHTYYGLGFKNTYINISLDNELTIMNKTSCMRNWPFKAQIS